MLFSKRAAAAFDKTSKGDAVNDDDEHCFDDDANWLSNSIILLLIFNIYSMHILIQCASSSMLSKIIKLVFNQTTKN